MIEHGFCKLLHGGGVWLFFLLSGYLIGKGFYTERYHLTTKGIFDYYLGRFFKVALPTLMFIFVCCVLIQPDFLLKNPIFIRNILTLSYDGTPSFDGIGATWYISTLMSLYICAPLLFWILKSIEKRIKNIKFSIWIWSSLLIIIIGIGMFIRLSALKFQWDWSSKVYVPFYMNLDIFFCGMIFNYISSRMPDKIYNKITKAGSTGLVLGLVLLNSYIYYKNHILFYQYILPSVYIVIIGIYLVVFDKAPQIREKESFHIIDWFSEISFGFYLFHSLILNRIYLLVSGATPLTIHIKLLIYSCFLTIPFAYFMKLIVNQCSGLYGRIKNIRKV